MSRLTRDGIAELVSRDPTLRRERGEGNMHFPCSADHEQDWQPPWSSYICDHTYIYTLLKRYLVVIIYDDNSAIEPHNNRGLGQQ